MNEEVLVSYLRACVDLWCMAPRKVSLPVGTCSNMVVVLPKKGFKSRHGHKVKYACNAIGDMKLMPVGEPCVCRHECGMYESITMDEGELDEWS